MPKKVTALPRIYFDSNLGSANAGYMLVFEKSLSDLKRAGKSIKDGAKVIIYMPDELECEAVLEYDAHSEIWRAYPSGEWNCGINYGEGD